MIMNSRILTNKDTKHGVQYNIYQNIKFINNSRITILNLMKQRLYKNNIKDSRNSKVISQFGEKMVFDLREGFLF